MDLNQDGVIRPFIFETQHSSASGEEEIAVDEETQEKYKRRNIYALTSWKWRVVLLRQLS